MVPVGHYSGSGGGCWQTCLFRHEVGQNIAQVILLRAHFAYYWAMANDRVKSLMRILAWLAPAVFGVYLWAVPWLSYMATQVPVVAFMMIWVSFFFIPPAVYSWFQIAEGKGDLAQHLKRIQALMYLAAAVGAAIVALSFSGDGDITVVADGSKLTCPAAPERPIPGDLAVPGVLYVISGGLALIVEPLRLWVVDNGLQMKNGTNQSDDWEPRLF